MCAPEPVVGVPGRTSPIPCTSSTMSSLVEAAQIQPQHMRLTMKIGEQLSQRMVLLETFDTAGAQQHQRPVARRVTSQPSSCTVGRLPSEGPRARAAPVPRSDREQSLDRSEQDIALGLARLRRTAGATPTRADSAGTAGRSSRHRRSMWRSSSSAVHVRQGAPGPPRTADTAAQPVVAAPRKHQRALRVRRAANSLTRRVLPIPGSPVTNAACRPSVRSTFESSLESLALASATGEH